MFFCYTSCCFFSKYKFLLPTFTYSTPTSFFPKFRNSFSFRDYKSVNKLISKFLSSFDWPSTLAQYYVNNTASVFNAALLLIEIFVPLRVIKDRGLPRWFSWELKDLIFSKKKNRAHLTDKKNNMPKRLYKIF